MSKTYEAALEAHNKAVAVFRQIQVAYRARQIGDAQFLAGRKIYDEATKAFDVAFTEEAAR